MPANANKKSQNTVIVDHIRSIQSQSYHSYGYRRVHAKLTQEQVKCGKNKVQALMKAHKLNAKRKKKHVVTTHSQHNRTIKPNLLNRQFKVTKPNTHWVSDISYVRTKAGWAYLAVIIDLYSRSVVGWSMDRQIQTFLVLNALESAIKERKPQRGLIFHSDRGIQYASDIFQKVLHRHGIIGSMSRKGDCWDNAVAESFFKTIKSDLGLRKNRLSFDDTEQEIAKYIDEFYNNCRLHSYTGYMPPLQFEMAA